MTTTTQPVLLTPAAIGDLRAMPFGGLDGVSHRVLWRSAQSMAGVMTVDGGHQLGAHAHRENHHHMWVLDGRAVILGQEVGAGTYLHIPAGVEHDIDATGTQGCTLLYLYVREAE